MATIKENVLILSSGRQIPVSCGNLTIKSNLEITTGWQSHFLVINETKIKDEKNREVSNPYNLSKEDVNEIADYMMRLWMRLKENILIHGLESERIFEAVS